jgi:hypothetical protein
MLLYQNRSVIDLCPLQTLLANLRIRLNRNEMRATPFDTYFEPICVSFFFLPTAGRNTRRCSLTRAFVTTTRYPGAASPPPSCTLLDYGTKNYLGTACVTSCKRHEQEKFLNVSWCRATEELWQLKSSNLIKMPRCLTDSSGEKNLAEIGPCANTLKSASFFSPEETDSKQG